MMEAALRSEANPGGGEDAELVARVQAGDGEAFGLLVRRYQDRVYNACWRISRNAEDARDLAQEAFVKAFRAIGSFETRSGFYTWLFRIAVNLALSHKRRAALRVVGSLDDTGADSDGPAAGRFVAGDDASRGLDEMEADELCVRVADGMNAIDASHRAVLVLRDVEGFDYEKIAEVLDVPLGTVKSRVHRARSALREVVERRLGQGESGKKNVAG